MTFTDDNPRFEASWLTFDSDVKSRDSLETVFFVSQCVGLEVVVLVDTARPIKKTDSIGHLHCLKVKRL